MPISRSFFVALAFLGSLLVAACGGGDPEPEPASPRIELMANQMVRLHLVTDEQGQVLGFSQPFQASPDVEIRWHSGMVSANMPYAPRGAIVRAADGQFYADISLAYALDRGIFAVAKKGWTVTFDQGQPAVHLVAPQWEMGSGIKLADVGFGRQWLDISFH